MRLRSNYLELSRKLLICGLLAISFISACGSIASTAEATSQLPPSTPIVLVIKDTGWISVEDLAPKLTGGIELTTTPLPGHNNFVSAGHPATVNCPGLPGTETQVLPNTRPDVVYGATVEKGKLGTFFQACAMVIEKVDEAGHKFTVTVAAALIGIADGLLPISGDPFANPQGFTSP